MAEKRDLKADLELCRNATPGPWEYLYEYSYENDYPRTIAHRVRIGEETLTIDTHDPNWEGAQEAISNAKFIAQAREGWPHAIERAMRAEEALVSMKLNLRMIEHLTQGNRCIELTRAVKHAYLKIEEVLGDEYA